jgi:transcriptional regulator with XRE-family HTH domain
MTDPDPTVQRRRLRVELRRARDMARLKQADVASAMDWSPSKLIRIEKGDVSISTNDLKALLSYYGVEDERRVNELVEVAKSARGASFFDQYADLILPGFKEYLAYEASASVIRQYDPVYIPGLLQTEEYARALFEEVGRFDPTRADKTWAIRQHRQELHDRENPPEMRFVVDEAALRRQIGGRRVMRHQLERLKESAAKPQISLQVMPFVRGGHPGLDGSFVLLEFPDPNLDDLVHLEGINQATVRDEVDVIARYLDLSLRLERLALSHEESIVFLDKLITEDVVP